MRDSSLLILEIIWIATGVLCIAVSIRLAVAGNTARIPLFALLSIVSFLFAWLRYRQRKKR
jgi:hypothetical protein